MSRLADRIVGWVASFIAAFLTSFILNVAVIVLFANGRHPQLIDTFFSISKLIFYPGFEGGIIVVAGNVLIIAIPLTLLFALKLRRYTF